jgi:hypothetical protein
LGTAGSFDCGCAFAQDDTSLKVGTVLRRAPS